MILKTGKVTKWGGSALSTKVMGNAERRHEGFKNLFPHTSRVTRILPCPSKAKLNYTHEGLRFILDLI